MNKHQNDGELLDDDHLEWLLSPQESETDVLLCEALNSFKANSNIPPTRTDSVPNMSRSPVLQCRFAGPKTDMETVAAQKQGVPIKMQQDTKYCQGLRQAWKDHRNSTTGTNIAALIELTTKIGSHLSSLKSGKRMEMNFLLIHYTILFVVPEMEWKTTFRFFNQSEFRHEMFTEQRSRISEETS